MGRCGRIAAEAAAVAWILGAAGCGGGKDGRGSGSGGIDTASGTDSSDGTQTDATTDPSAGTDSGISTTEEPSMLPKFDVAGGVPPCVNLQCDQVACDDPGVTTTLTGTVYDPSGTLPLYNVQVYIPNSPVEPLVDEITCDQCNAQLSGNPLVSDVTDTQGRFVLENVPVTPDLPLVMQLGKWRRYVTIPTVNACEENALGDPNVTRLPRRMQEGHALDHLPRIALSTGSADPLFCLLRRLQLDDSEYGIEGSSARVHFYRGSTGSSQYDGGFGASPGASFPDADETLWNTGWEDYDIVLLSCEGDEYHDDKDGYRVRLRDYLDIGGRAFATHYHYSWMQTNDAPDDLASVADFSGPGFGAVNGQVDIDVSFEKGEALADWLFFVDGASPWSHFQVSGGRDHTDAIQAVAQRWVTYGNDEQIMYFSFNAPIYANESEQCGRMVYSDIHVSTGAGSPTQAFPGACNDSPLSEQEKVLLFMLFDLSACITPDVPPG
jgi:hypothetical protein